MSLLLLVVVEVWFKRFGEGEGVGMRDSLRRGAGSGVVAVVAKAAV